MIRVIYFDQGGVLVKNFGGYQRNLLSQYSGKSIEKSSFVWRKYWSSLKVGKLEDEEFWFGKKEDSELSLGVLSELEIPRDKYAELSKKFNEQIKPFSYTKDLLQKTSQKFYIGLLSNNSYEWGEQVLRKNDLEKYFNKMIWSHRVGMKKPDKEIYALAFSELEIKISPEELLFVDDKESNLIIPRQLGWKTYLFDSEKYEDFLTYIKLK